MQVARGRTYYILLSQPAPAEAAAEPASIDNECQRRSQICGCRAMTQMQQMERAMLEQSNRKRATILAKTAVAIVAAAMLVPLEPAALIPSDGGANSAIRLQQLAYGGHNFEGGIGKTFPDKQSRAGLFVCGRGRYRDSATGRCLGPADSPD